MIGEKSCFERGKGERSLVFEGLLVDIDFTVLTKMMFFQASDNLPFSSMSFIAYIRSNFFEIPPVLEDGLRRKACEADATPL